MSLILIYRCEKSLTFNKRFKANAYFFASKLCVFSQLNLQKPLATKMACRYYTLKDNNTTLVDTHKLQTLITS